MDKRKGKIMKKLIGYTIDELTVGQEEAFSKTVTETDVYNYVGISCDNNPAHINEEYAKETPFKTRIVHGMLSAGFMSAVLGTKLPGPGTIYASQSLKFVKPVLIGDTITAKVVVKEINKEKNRVILETTCTNQNDELVIKGEAVALPPKKEF